uniref:Coiled-coil domain containing 30 n=1 Tax=Mola mola TaxID=94237 RepID=A0A3Q3X098_MOLML
MEQISVRLRDDGLPAGASVEEQRQHLWQQLLNTETKLQSVTEELQTLRTQQAKEMEEESQGKELAEMLAQEDLREMGLCSPSEQVAYLLVERATLLERLEAAERRLGSQSVTDVLKEVQQQEPICYTRVEELRQQRAHSEEISQGRNERQRLERDLEEASRRLAMAHQDIRRLTNELDASELQGMVQEVENLRKEVDKLKHSMMKLQQAKEQNEKVDAENRTLRETVRTLESEKRCREALEDGFVQVRELQRQLQRLRKDQEELEERNEELEALLGEAQNASKEDRHRHDGELEGLQRRRDSSQERLALLEARLTEEKDWRKQLEADLSAAQAALRKDKEALQIGERELKKLRLEVKSLQTECQQGKTLIKSLTQVKGEKAVLEEKQVAQMERAHSRLQSELERYKDSDRTREDLRDNRLQVDQLQGQADRLTAELSSLQTAHNALLKLQEERQLALQHQLALQAQVNEAQGHIKAQDLVLSQKAEEAKQMKQDLQRAQSLFTSAERELRYEKEKNMDLMRHNTLLDQEKLKLCAELKQVQTKLAQVELSVHTQVAECERQQLKIRELELELARNSTNRSATTSLQEDLQAEKARLIAADKKQVLELQQQLKSAQHQLRVEEARAVESVRLERDSRDLSDALSALRAKQQEQHITKLLEQREEELQQQVRSLRLNEATMTRTNAELSHRAQQLDTRLTIVEVELSKAKEETSSHRMQEDLVATQQECDRVQGELQQVLLQLDSQVRKYDEKQSQRKTKLRQARQLFLKATAQRDCIIQTLENDLLLASSLSRKEKERIQIVTEENEKLLEEKRELLRRISEAEEMGSKGMRTASTVQHVNILEVENRQLQDRTLKLSSQVSSLERALRNVQTFYSLELASGPYDPLDILDTICRVKMDGTQASVSTQQPSEQGYLNLASPAVRPGTKGTEESPANSEPV